MFPAMEMSSILQTYRVPIVNAWIMMVISEDFTFHLSLTVQIIVWVTITSIRQLWQVNSTSIWTLNGDQFAGHGDSPDNNRLLILYKDGNHFDTLYLYLHQIPTQVSHAEHKYNFFPILFHGLNLLIYVILIQQE